MKKRRKDTRRRTEYHREYARRVRGPKLRTERAVKARQRAVWRFGMCGTYAVWWSQSGARWGPLARAEGVLLLSRVDKPTAKAVAEALGWSRPRPQRVGIVRVSPSGHLTRYSSIREAARINGHHRVTLYRSTYADSAACAACEGYSDSVNFSEFAGRADFRGFTWLRTCTCG